MFLSAQQPMLELTNYSITTVLLHGRRYLAAVGTDHGRRINSFKIAFPSLSIDAAEKRFLHRPEQRPSLAVVLGH